MDAPHGKNGYVDRILDPRSQVQKASGRHIHGRNNPVRAFVYATGHANGIQADILEPSGDRTGILQGQPPLNEFVGRKTTGNRVIGP